MTISEAAKKWNVKPNTVCEYIANGYILNLQADNNQIILPDILAPRVKKKPQSERERDVYIIKALNESQYVSYPILGITQEHFAERLKALEKSGCIFKRDEDCNDYSTNMNFILNTEKASKQYHIHLKIFAPEISLLSL